jgi:hypothetical protein
MESNHHHPIKMSEALAIELLGVACYHTSYHFYLCGKYEIGKHKISSILNCKTNTCKSFSMIPEDKCDKIFLTF